MVSTQWIRELECKNRFPTSGQSVNEVPVHDVKYMVWSVLSGTRLTEPALRRFHKTTAKYDC